MSDSNISRILKTGHEMGLIQMTECGIYERMGYQYYLTWSGYSVLQWIEKAKNKELIEGAGGFYHSPKRK